MQITINGKQVTLRDRMSGARGWRAMQTLMRLSQAGDAASIMEALEYGAAIDLCCAAVESWEFEGDPSQATSYEALDSATELLPLVTEAMRILGERVADSKNS